jgi:hypothetical protein
MLIFGGARLGRLADGAVLRVTDIGQYLLGATARFEYSDTGAADLVVQPNFDPGYCSASPVLKLSWRESLEQVRSRRGSPFASRACVDPVRAR